MAWGSPLNVAFHEVPHKEERITLSCGGAEGQVMLGEGWSQSQRCCFPVAGIAWGWKSHKGFI